MDNINFKTYDPVAQLVALGSGSGSGLPLTGGTLSGNLTLSIPSKVIQCQTPSNSCDLVNLIYLQSLYLPLSGGTMSGVIIQPSLPVASGELTNKAYVDSLIGGGPFLPLTGGIMSGAITQPTAPSTANDLTNKAYVDAQVASGVPDATTSVKGKLQLSGDLSGTAAAPIVAPMAITNAKLANLSAVSQLKGSSSASSTATDITLGSGLTMTSSTLNIDQTTLNKAGATQFGMIEFDPSGDLDSTSTNSGIGVVKAAAITNAKINPGGNSTLKGSTGGIVDDINLDPTLIMLGTNLSVDTASLEPAGATQFGVIEFDPSGDLNATSTNSGIGVVKPLAITNAKLANLSAVSQLKGSGSASSAAADLSLGSGLSITGTTLSINTASLSSTFLPLAGGVMSGAISQPLAPSVANDLANKAYVDAQITSVTVPDATTTVKGKIQLAGDLSGTAATPVIGTNKVTYPKIQQLSASSLLGNSTGSLANVQEIILGSLLFSSNVLNSPISFYSGTDPNVTAPTDRPSSVNTLYQGTDNYVWVWNGTGYSSLTPKKFISTARNLSDQTMATDDLVEFSPLVVNQTSTQGLSIIDATNGSIFTITLGANRPTVLLKITVSISGLYTPGVIAKFFTYNLTAALYTNNPGLILNNGNAIQITSTHSYSEILSITPGSIDIGVKLRNITGGTSINIGNGGGVPLPYRWILFEEV
ncbi:hypothetical protein WIV_gp113 [Wiseana iridescent virus]|uniref:Uncharacterized protein n=1 Tax=Wiseana iridescent virus TaxID=68347 RepID=G0T5D9_IRV9|nr:hypothetical protein WIV_gp113 [Wiseana iridescent virus]ADO00457.1 hypothetical protein [Wiseana iridescent virus]